MMLKKKFVEEINFEVRDELVMANLIVICGPQAVGKMTVAESLRDKLRYNMMIKQDLKGMKLRTEWRKKRQKEI